MEMEPNLDFELAFVLQGPAISIEGSCSMCPRKGSKHCKGCIDAKYCSQECQKLDWKTHKLLCKSFVSDRPSEDHRRVLFFPGDVSSPRFEWVKIEKRSEDDEYYETYDVQGLFGGYQVGDTYRSAVNQIQNRFMGRATDGYLRCIRPRDPMLDSFPPNTAIRSFTRTGICRVNFRGPVIILSGKDANYPKILDFDMHDVRNAADWLVQLCEASTPRDHLSTSQYLGAVIRCEEVQARDSVPQYDEGCIPGTSGVWTHPGSEIANLLGLPILACSMRPPSMMADNVDHSSRAAQLLFRDISSASILAPQPSSIAMFGPLVETAKLVRSLSGSTGYGSTPVPMATRKTGNIYAVRADGKPLPKEHLEVMCGYIRDEVEPKLIAARARKKLNEIVKERDEILDSITKASFSAYYEKMKDQKVRQGVEGWDVLPDPYSIKANDLADRKLMAARRDGWRIPAIP